MLSLERHDHHIAFSGEGVGKHHLETLEIAGLDTRKLRALVHVASL